MHQRNMAEVQKAMNLVNHFVLFSPNSANFRPKSILCSFCANFRFFYAHDTCILKRFCVLNFLGRKFIRANSNMRFACLVFGMEIVRQTQVHFTLKNDQEGLLRLALTMLRCKIGSERRTGNSLWTCSPLIKVNIASDWKSIGLSIHLKDKETTKRLQTEPIYLQKNQNKKRTGT